MGLQTSEGNEDAALGCSGIDGSEGVTGERLRNYL